MDTTLTKPLLYSYKSVLYLTQNNSINHAKFIGSAKNRIKHPCSVNTITNDCLYCAKPISKRIRRSDKYCQCSSTGLPDLQNTLSPHIVEGSLCQLHGGVSCNCNVSKLSELSTKVPSVFSYRISRKSASKIERKLYAWFHAKIERTFTFLTLTFINKVDEKQAVKTLNNFLTTVRKQDGEFRYLWVAEKQKNNTRHKDNLHFHLVTNKFWNIDYSNSLWVRTQNNAGIYHPDGKTNLHPLDVSKVKTVRNFGQIGAYITKYITKNESVKNSDSFSVSPWHCCRWISNLATGVRHSANYTTSISAVKSNYRLSKLDKETGELAEKPIFKHYAEPYEISVTKNVYNPHEKVIEKEPLLIGWSYPIYNLKPFAIPLFELRDYNRIVLSMNKQQLKTLKIPSLHDYDLHMSGESLHRSISKKK